MKLGIVRARERTVEIVHVAELHDAKVIAGLDPDKTDHGSIFPGLGYVCGEYAMFEHPMFYFTIGRVLFAGNIVLYAYTTRGNTVDLDLTPGRLPVVFVGGEAAVEAAIKAGKIDRPQASIDGDVYWRWPEPKPDMEAVWKRMNEDALKHGGVVQIDDVTIVALPPNGEKEQ